MATYNAKKLTITNQGDTYIIDPLQGNDVAYMDFTVTIQTSDWTLSNGVYTYTWSNNHLTQNSAIQVYFKDGVRTGLTGDLKCNKTTGSITFTTDSMPSASVSLLVRVIDAVTTEQFPIDAELVSTDAIVGETTVQGALEDLDERISEMSGGQGIDVSFTIPANGWSNSAPFTYTWSSEHVGSESSIEVEFGSGAEDTDIVYLEYQKVTGGVQFTSPNKPAVGVPVNVHVNAAKADVLVDLSDEDISSDAITGAVNVNEALIDINGRIPEVINNLTSDSITDALSAAQGKALNSKIANVGLYSMTNPVSPSTTIISDTTLGRKFASPGFAVVGHLLTSDDRVLASTIVPMTEFKAGNDNFVRYISDDGTKVTGHFQYYSDTKVSLFVSNGSGHKVRVFMMSMGTPAT